MKKRLFAYALALLLGGCSAQPASLPQTPAPTPEPTVIDLSHLTEDGGAASMDFTVRLLQQTVAAAPEENALLSPFSVWSALGMTAGGAAGTTRDEMAAALGMTPETLGAYLSAYADSLAGDDCLHSANGIWLREGGLTLDPAFLQFNESSYHATVRQAAFDAATVREINDWVKEHTNGRIEDIVGDLDDAARLVLVNALAFDAEWERIYTEDNVRSAAFTTATGAKQNVRMMYSDERTLLQDGADAVGFIKYYAGRRYAFAALLPAEGTSVEEYVAGLTGARLQSVLANPKGGVTVSAGMPVFRVDASYSLKDPLSAMGMPGAFAPDTADFSAIAQSDEPLYIGEVVHKTYLAVDERGTQAGAATAVMVDTLTAIRETHRVILDRPFVYLLIDCEQNMPLFIGTVMSVE